VVPVPPGFRLWPRMTAKPLKFGFSWHHLLRRL